MSWQIEALGGPVLAWELKRATRQKRWRILWISYCAWLMFQAIQAVVLFNAFLSGPRPPGFQPQLSRGELIRTQNLLQSEYMESFFQSLLHNQLLLILAIVPAITASCLGQEKERGTLFALFGTQLTSREILVGKLLGRLMLLVPLVLTTLPILVFIATLTGRSPAPVLLALVQQAILALALGAICLLFGIWVRKSADAVIAAYLFLGLAYVFIRGLTASMPEAFWFDPIDNQDKMLKGAAHLEFAFHLAIWALLGLACLRLGWGLLRKVCVEQRDKRPSRRLWAFRPAVGNNAIRWRECYVIGLAPMPILRIVPRWLALVGVFVFSAAIAGLVSNKIAPGFITAVLQFDLFEATNALRRSNNAIAESVWQMGLIFIALADLLLLVRCGTSVAEEKRRNTWDDLLLTAQSFREITSGKMWGILQAIVPYLIAYAMPVFILASVGGPYALMVAFFWIILPCTIVYAAALAGIDMLKVPRDMDETREGGAFAFERKQWGPFSPPKYSNRV